MGRYLCKSTGLVRIWHGSTSTFMFSPYFSGVKILGDFQSRHFLWIMLYNCCSWFSLCSMRAGWRTLDLRRQRRPIWNIWNALITHQHKALECQELRVSGKRDVFAFTPLNIFKIKRLWCFSFISTVSIKMRCKQGLENNTCHLKFIQDTGPKHNLETYLQNIPLTY